MTQTSVALVRCSACQLQLCKSREQQPHSSLTETRPQEIAGLRGDEADRYFTCQACSATLINSENRTKPGWRQHRAA